MQGLTGYAWILGVLSLVIAWAIYKYVKGQPNGTELMQDLEGSIHEGAMAFLKKEYSILVIFIAVVFIRGLAREAARNNAMTAKRAARIRPMTTMMEIRAHTFDMISLFFISPTSFQPRAGEVMTFAMYWVPSSSKSRFPASFF